MSRKDYIKGQKDGSRKKYDSPNDRGLLSILIPYDKNERERRKAYHDGMRNAKKQR
jgi:hypothetical protein